MVSIVECRSEVSVPILLLETTELTRSEKLVWVALALDAGMKEKPRLSYTRLAERIGFCRQTVAMAVDRLEALGWYAKDARGTNEMHLSLPKLAGKAIEVAARLLLDTSISPGARLMHMQVQVQLQATEARKETFQFKYAALSKELRRGVKAVRKAVKQLVQASWLKLEQANRVAPILLTARNPVREAYEQMRASAAKHLNRAEFLGETLMREALSLLVDSENFVDDGSVGFLVNPRTGERMQFDRYYPKHDVAFEFNGAQHYQATELYDQETADKQRARDAVKRDICAKNGVDLVVVHPQDLSLGQLLQKLRNLLPRLPLRNLVGGESIIEFLETACANYRRRVPAVIAL